MASRNAFVTLAIAVALLGAIILSVGAYYLGVAIVDMDPGDPDNYDNQVQADDPEAQREQRQERGDTATLGWGLMTGGSLLGVGGLALGLMAPARDSH